MKKTDYTAAEEVVQSLVDHGIKNVFGMTGDTILPILDVLYDRKNDIRYIPAKGEIGVASMADGYSRVTGEPSCCMFHVGPAVSNSVMSVWNAQRDSVPLVVLSANMDRFRLGRNIWHEFDVIGVFEKFTKWNHQMLEPKDTRRLMRTAFQMAVSGIPGPVHVDFPKDLLAQSAAPQQEWDFSQLGAARSADVRNDARPAAEAVAKTLDLLSGAKSPVIIAGRGVVWSRGWTELVKFAELHSIPVVTTEMGRGAIPESHPLAGGLLGHFGRSSANELVKEADVVLGLGCQFANVNLINWSLIQPGAKIIQVESDPLEIGRQYAVTLGVLADSGAFLRDCLDASKQKKSEANSEARHKRIADLKAQELQRAYDTDLSAVPIKPQLVPQVVSKFMTDDTVVSVGSGYHTQFGNQVPISKPNRYIISAGSGCMATAFPSALGAKLALPNSPVFCLVGDGDFGMNAKEIETSVREDLPVVVIIFNDCAFGALQRFQKAQHKGRYIGSNYLQTDFPKLAEAYGANGILVTRPEELEPAVETALKSKVTTVIDVRVDPWENHYRAAEFKDFHRF